MKFKILLFCLVPCFLEAQVRKIEAVGEAYVAYEITTDDGETDFEEILITKQTPGKVLNDYLDYHHFLDIQFNEDSLSPYPFRVQLTKGNWVLYSVNNSDFNPSEEEKKLSFEFPEKQFFNTLCFIKNKKNQTALYHLDEATSTEFYDAIKITNREDFRLNFEQLNQLKARQDSLEYYDAQAFFHENEVEFLRLEENLQIDKIEFAVRKKNKWARFKYLPLDNVFMAYTPFVYENMDELPAGELSGNPDQDLVFGFLAENFNAVDFELIDSNAYMIKFKDFKTKKIGFYYGEGEQEPSLSAIYDEITIEQKAECLIVSSKGKLGAFNFYGNEIVPIEYDNIEIIFLDFTYGLMVASNSTWQLFDSFSGDLLMEEKFSSVEALLESWRNR